MLSAGPVDQTSHTQPPSASDEGRTFIKHRLARVKQKRWPQRPHSTNKAKAIISRPALVCSPGAGPGLVSAGGRGFRWKTRLCLSAQEHPWLMQGFALGEKKQHLNNH